MANLFEKKDFDFFKSLIVKAGQAALASQKNTLSVQRKKDTSIVTETDLMIQNLLIKEIKKQYPDINFIYEEDFDRDIININDDTISVIIDPIDGTAMFSMYLPIWCISIGVFKGYEPAYGFVYSPASDMLFFNDNDSSYLNGIKVNVKNDIEIDSETNIFYASEIHRSCEINFQGKIRNLGSTALQACLVVDNERNRSLAFIGKSYLWDWAGAIPVILKAGGNVKYINGRDIDYAEIIKNRYKLPDFLVAYTTKSFQVIQDIIQII